jgi:glutaminase
MNPPIVDWLLPAQQLAQSGTLPAYIPQLQAANPQAIAVAITPCDSSVQIWGESPPRIALMSVVKPFLLLYCLTEWGDNIWKRVGREPSSEPFNSLEQLRRDRGFPRNPMINSGAIALAGSLIGDTPDGRCDRFCQWLNRSGQTLWQLDRELLASVDSLPNERNRAIAQTLTEAGYVPDASLALATYNHLCCLTGSLSETAQLGRILLEPPLDISLDHCLTVRQVMTDCGLYEASAEFQQRIGLPSKSGVTGLILALVPHRKLAIALYSPPLDAQGNSLAGLWLLEQIAHYLQHSVWFTFDDRCQN